jgi:hypothetical protein
MENTQTGPLMGCMMILYGDVYRICRVDRICTAGLVQFGLVEAFIIFTDIHNNKSGKFRRDR